MWVGGGRTGDGGGGDGVWELETMRLMDPFPLVMILGPYKI